MSNFRASRFGIFCRGTLAYVFNEEECSGKYYDGNKRTNNMETNLIIITRNRK